MRDDGDEMPSPGKVETLRQQGIVHGGVSKVVQTKGGLLRLPYTTKSQKIGAVSTSERALYAVRFVPSTAKNGRGSGVTTTPARPPNTPFTKPSLSSE